MSERSTSFEREISRGLTNRSPTPIRSPQSVRATNGIPTYLSTRVSVKGNTMRPVLIRRTAIFLCALVSTCWPVLSFFSTPMVSSPHVPPTGPKPHRISTRTQQHQQARTAGRQSSAQLSQHQSWTALRSRQGDSENFSKITGDAAILNVINSTTPVVHDAAPAGLVLREFSIPLQESPGEYAKQVQRQCDKEGGKAKVVRWHISTTDEERGKVQVEVSCFLWMCYAHSKKKPTIYQVPVRYLQLTF